MLNIFKIITNKPHQKTWIRLVIISWILVVICTFITTILSWIMISPLEPEKNPDWILWLTLIPLILALLITGLPLFMAFFRSELRAKIYTSPFLGATSLFILSFLISFILLVSMEVIFQLTGMDPFFHHRQPYPNNFIGVVLSPILTGFIIGIISFPLTFGLVFPLAIPIACAIGVWAIIDEHHKISRKAWNLLMIGATLGWMLTSIVGYVLGQA